MSQGEKRPTVPIERGIPIPDIERGRPKRGFYPWADMAIGDSFLIVGSDSAPVSTMKKQASIKYGCEYIQRRTGNGIRVWRVA